MCGIAGIVTVDQRQAEDAIRRMVPAMIHRGPDDSGHEMLPTVHHGRPAFAAFGFRRLAILDLSPAGHQPMVDAATGDCLIFNGEIYNYRTLRSDLEAEGCRFRSSSDTEVLLHALGRWGDRALERLEGMYALAYHRAADGAVLIARDPLGIKPLYVADTDDGFLFASEIRTLLASGVVPRDLDADGIAAMLAFGSAQAPRTVFAGISEFPAGHAQWLGQPPRPFWSFPPPRTAPDGDAVGLVRRLIDDSVRRHLVADVPVGVFLSAGIDSTVIAACAAEAGSHVTAFTVGIGARYPEDEAAVATATAQRLGMSHEVVTIDSESLPGLWRRWIDALDSPSIDGFNTFIVTKALADRGIKVALSGLGADELFGGYPAFRTAPLLARFAGMLGVLPRSLVTNAAERLLRWEGRPGPAEKVAGILAAGHDPATVAQALRRIIADGSLVALGLRPPADPTTSPAGVDAFNAVARMEMTHYMRNTLLRDSDANSMSHSLELRVPFLDLPLVNAVSALAGRVKQSGGGPGKQLLRAAMTSRLPAAVTQRRKTGFTLPIADWMRGEMRDVCTAAIETCAALPMLRADAVRRTWTEYLRDPARMSWTRPFALVVLGSYLGQHGRAGI
jgi:asparagine synthase (glutamine-hydrolysing)